MLHDALKSDHFGSLENITFLLMEALSPAQPRSTSDIVVFCEEKSVVFASSLQSILALFVHLSLVEVDAGGRFLRKNNIDHQTDVAALMIERIFTSMAEDGTLSEFISPEAIEYDPIENVVCVRNNFIPLDLSGLKNLLMAIGFLKQHYLSSNLLMITRGYEALFEDTIVPSIKTERFSGVHPKNLSLAALMKIQELNEIHGKEAEEFVVAFERRRIADPNLTERIRRVSDMQCDAGYDVVSFHDPDSKAIDRFIEVKSHAGEPSFFWSRNEVAVAKIKADSYFLYLVDRTKMSRPGYEPLMIRNPHETVFLNEKVWQRDAMSWHFYK